jgi:hypothetical protein
MVRRRGRQRDSRRGGVDQALARHRAPGARPSEGAALRSSIRARADRNRRGGRVPWTSSVGAVAGRPKADGSAGISALWSAPGTARNGEPTVRRSGWVWCIRTGCVDAPGPALSRT